MRVSKELKKAVNRVLRVSCGTIGCTDRTCPLCRSKKEVRRLLRMCGGKHDQRGN